MRSGILNSSVLAAYLVLTSAVFATERLVPSQYPNIQVAIDDCNNGDVVIVAPGTYTGTGNKNITFLGKAITVRSTNPKDPDIVATTVIDCENVTGHRGFYFHSGEGANSIVSGFTIKRGKITGSNAKGGGIYCSESSPTVENCIIADNSAFGADGYPGKKAYGAGIYCELISNPVIANCTISNNHSKGGEGLNNFHGESSYGGGIYSTSDSNPTIKNCILSDNKATGGKGGDGWEENGQIMVGGNGGDGLGAGIYCDSGGMATIENCTISNNTAVGGIGGAWGGTDGISRGGGVHSDATASNCIVWGNTADSSPQIYGSCTVSYSDVQGGYSGEGTIDADPCLVDLAGGDYHLSPGSPCINAGDPCYAQEPNETDIDGEPRVMGGRVDMGADEISEEDPFLEVTPTTFEFIADEGGANPNTQILSIYNSGGGTLNWEISEDCSWLTAEPNIGSSTGEVDDVNLMVDISGLTGGIYNCNLTVFDPCALNSPQIVAVSLNVTGPAIELSATQFQFTAIDGGANPNDQTLSISNSGGGTLNWTASCDCNWLSVEPNSGSSTGEVDDVNLSVDISSITSGIYTCDITVSDVNASNNPQTAGVNLHASDADGTLYVPSEYSTIQEAIDVALDGDIVIVEPNTYTGSGNKNLDFGGKAITVRSIDPNDPCVVTATVIDCENSGRGFYFHSGEGANSIVSGFTITRGKILVYGGSGSKGGGIYCEGSSPTIKNCTITNNLAHGYHGTESSPNGKSAYGGGVYCTSNSHLTLIGCTISSNQATGGEGNELWCSPMSGCSGALGDGGDSYGGGIYSSTDSSLTIVDCTIIDNSVTGGSGGTYYETGEPMEGAGGGRALGGGIYTASSATTINNCSVLSNIAIGGDGGEGISEGEAGMCSGGGLCGALTITNSIISGNNASVGTGMVLIPDSGGGGIGCRANSSITNCLIIDNNISAPFGFGTGVLLQYGDISIKNCTVLNNTPTNIYSVETDLDGSVTATISDSIIRGHNGYDVGATCSVTYSCTEQIVTGVGNIQSDPCFVTGPEGDYYLSQIAAGQAVDSPCVDAGSDTAAALGMDITTTRTDHIGDAYIVDMGYHYPMPNPADIDGDEDVDLFDYAILAAQWQQPPSVPSADIAPPGGDNIVDGLDLDVLADNWLEGL